MSTALDRGEHGATAWRLGCRCDRCRAGLRRAGRVWWAARRVRAGAEPASRVPPGRLLAHLDQLVVAGLSVAEVARRAGVCDSTLCRARRPDVKVSRIVERLVLAVEP
jgi:lambda repressor-like predicted transcriptional regulator